MHLELYRKMPDQRLKSENYTPAKQKMIRLSKSFTFSAIIFLTTTKKNNFGLLDYQIMVENRSMMTSEVHKSRFITVEMNDCEAEYVKVEKLFDQRF
ncbi:hypothetical protein T11_11762 [Trichinella zimbabwensis]|uniref:Uncharacterized protein n=1 Tax=Trichinella zimbabwensis TaxID=268475 RepID=A0A0V1HD90_9BILA|nr:hypothetical protein T11_11762 [Trichinella zimbabwensis]